MKKRLSVIGVLAVTACGGGGGGVSAIVDKTVSASTAEVQSPGGLWYGVDTADNESAILVEENGSYFFIDGTYKGSSGLLTIVNDGLIQGSLLLPKESGLINSDDVSNNDCNLKGSLVERESMTLEVRCRAEANQQVLSTISFTYDPVYERDASLSTLAGIFDFRVGLVLDISVDGMIFGQDSVSGCVFDGQVTIANEEFNIYGLNWGLIDCVGPDASLNGERFSGFALLDNTVSPEQLIVAMSRNSSTDQTTSNSGSSSSSGSTGDNEQTKIIVFANRL